MYSEHYQIISWNVACQNNILTVVQWRKLSQVCSQGKHLLDTSQATLFADPSSRSSWYEKRVMCTVVDLENLEK